MYHTSDRGRFIRSQEAILLCKLISRVQCRLVKCSIVVCARGLGLMPLQAGQGHVECCRLRTISPVLDLGYMLGHMFLCPTHPGEQCMHTA